MQQGVIKFRLKDVGAHDPRRQGYDFTTNKVHALPSIWEIQQAFLERLRKDGFEPFDSDDDGFQYWRKSLTGALPRTPAEVPTKAS